jgi:1,4-dihydroxy-2-naphthoate octaprenyltransferase
MLAKSTLLHLRFPFSFFLLPVFLFAAGNVRNPNIQDTFLAFFIIHFLLYPASNGYNSYFDKDEKSIGLLKNPPAVRRELYFVSLFLDMAAILLGLFISYVFSFMLLMYGLVSKAYSHPAIRIKKYPILSWFIAGFFQGFFTYLMSMLAMGHLSPAELLGQDVLIPAALCTFLLWGSYPMTQVYQHEEDYRRGDMTLSIRLGIKGTFIFSAIVFLIADALFIIYFSVARSVSVAMQFEVFLVPMMIYFFRWFFLTLKNPQKADYLHAMRLNLISSVCLNLFFGLSIL